MQNGGGGGGVITVLYSIYFWHIRLLYNYAQHYYFTPLLFTKNFQSHFISSSSMFIDIDMVHNVTCFVVIRLSLSFMVNCGANNMNVAIRYRTRLP